MDSGPDRAWSGKSRGGRFGYLFFVYAIRLLGVRGAYGFLAVVVLHFLPFAPRATRAIWSYNRQRRGLGRLRSVVELYRHYFVFGQTLIDRLALRSGLTDRYRFEFDRYERFLEIIDASAGAVLIGAHVGCWEAGAGFFGKYGRKIHIVMLDAEHRAIKEVLDRNTRAGDYRIIPIDRGPLEALVRIKNALDDGGYVCFNGDRYIDPATAREVRFLGAPARFPIGPFRIASRCRVPVVFYFAMREPGRRYRFLFREVPAAEARDTEALLGRYVESLEELMRRYPRQWFNFYSFWNN